MRARQYDSYRRRFHDFRVGRMRHMMRRVGNSRLCQPRRRRAFSREVGLLPCQAIGTRSSAPAHQMRPINTSTSRITTSNPKPPLGP